MPGGAGGRGGRGGGAAAPPGGRAGGGGGGRGGAFIGGFNPGFASRQRGTTPNVHAAACDFILWDILGKAVNRPIYKILGGTKDKVLAYASSQHWPRSGTSARTP